MDMIYAIYKTRAIFSGEGISVRQEETRHPSSETVSRLIVALTHHSEMPYNSIGETVDGQSLDSRLHGDFCLEKCNEQDGCYTEVYVSAGDARFDF